MKTEWQDIHRAADRYVPVLRRIVTRAFADAQAAVRVGALEAAVKKQDQWGAEHALDETMLVLDRGLRGDNLLPEASHFQALAAKKLGVQNVLHKTVVAGGEASTLCAISPRFGGDLTEDDIRLIRKLLAEGRDEYYIERDFDLTSEQLKAIKFSSKDATKDLVKKASSTSTRWEEKLKTEPGRFTRGISPTGRSFDTPNVQRFVGQDWPESTVDDAVALCRAMDDELVRLRKKFPKLSQVPALQEVNLAVTDDIVDFTGMHGVAFYENNRMAFAVRGTGLDELEKLQKASKGKLPWNVSVGGHSTLRHEFGHHVQANLPSSAQTEWRELHEKGLSKVSGYAGTNELESFAECFCLYTSPKMKPAMLPRAVLTFFKRWVG